MAYFCPKHGPRHDRGLDYVTIGDVVSNAVPGISDSSPAVANPAIVCTECVAEQVADMLRLNMPPLKPMKK